MDLLFNIKKGFSSDVETSKLLVFIANEDRNESNDKVLFALINAIKIAKEEVCFINYQKEDTITIPNGFEYVIVFGYNKNHHFGNTVFQMNKPYKMESCDLLCTHSISDLEADKAKKMVLWKSLQDMFLS